MVQSFYEKVPVYDGLSFFYRRQRVDAFRFGWHHHPEYELSWIVHGRGQRFVSDSIENFETGDLVLIGPDVSHSWLSQAEAKAKQKQESITIQFRHDFLGEDFFNKPELSAVSRMLGQSRCGITFRPSVKRLVTAMMAEIELLPPMQQLLKVLEILSILAEDSQCRLLCPTAQPAHHDRMSQQRFETIFDYITQHLDQPLTLPQTARQVYMSPSHFSRFFRRVSGKTFVQFVNELRISKACWLLSETDKSITEICFACGFNCIANFNRQFRRIKRRTPSAYRQSFYGNAV